MFLICCIVMAVAIVQRTKFSVPHLAKMWGIGPKKIKEFIDSGELKAINAATKKEQRPRYLIDIRDIEAFEQARRVIPDGAASEAPAPAAPRRRAGVRKFF